MGPPGERPGEGPALSEPNGSSGAPDLTPDERALLEDTFDRARSGDVDGLRELLGIGVPVNLTNGRGDTLLMLATYHGHTAAVELLLGLRADTARGGSGGRAGR